MQSILDDSILLGQKLIEADFTPGFDFDALPFDERQAHRYRTIYHRRGELHHQLMFEMLCLPEVRAKLAAIAGPEIKWVKWANPLNTLCQWVRKREAEMPVEQWPDLQKHLLKAQLRTVVELYDRL